MTPVLPCSHSAVISTVPIQPDGITPKSSVSPSVNEGALCERPSPVGRKVTPEKTVTPESALEPLPKKTSPTITQVPDARKRTPTPTDPQHPCEPHPSRASPLDVLNDSLDSIPTGSSQHSSLDLEDDDDLDSDSDISVGMDDFSKVRNNFSLPNIKSR